MELDVVLEKYADSQDEMESEEEYVEILVKSGKEGNGLIYGQVVLKSYTLVEGLGGLSIKGEQEMFVKVELDS
jgi:hypothetical protein